MAEGLTKKQLKELRKLEKMQAKSMDKKNESMKWLAISIISAIFLILFVGIIFVAKNKNKPQTVDGKAQFANDGHERSVPLNLTNEASNSGQNSEKIVTMVEYGDLQCPACKTYHPMVKELLAAFPGRLKLIFKNFPLTAVHPNAIAAATAAEAVGRQGKYFEMVDLLYDKQDEWAGQTDPQEKFEGYVKELKLDIEKFKKDQKDSAIQKIINTHRDEGIKNGVTGTPSFFVDGEKIENPASIDDFKKIINTALSNSTGVDTSKEPTTTTAPDKLPLQP